MYSVAPTTRPYQVAAKYAILYHGDDDQCGTNGVALRTPEGHVFFQAEATGAWVKLTSLKYVQYLGDKSLADAQALLDGDLARKASKTLQAA